MRFGFGIFKPFRLAVRGFLWAGWVVIVLLVITIGSHSPVPNHPVGLLLLGLGCAGSGGLAALALFSPAGWQRLIEPELDLREARTHLYWLVGLGVLGAVLISMALGRLL